jgi:hypothetical protein
MVNARNIGRMIGLLRKIAAGWRKGVNLQTSSQSGNCLPDRQPSGLLHAVNAQKGAEMAGAGKNIFSASNAPAV